MVTKIQIAWLAGILEGEGCFTMNGSAHNKQPIILMQSTDKDVVVRVANILGGQGYVIGKQRVGITFGKKIMYRYAVSSSLAIYWMRILLEYMGERRQDQIKYMLDLWDSIPHRKSDRKTTFPSIEGVM